VNYIDNFFQVYFLYMEALKMKSFVVEYRRRIQSGNAFIKFNNALEKYSTKISLRAFEIIINVDGDEHIINTEEYFNINVKSFHQLIVKDNFLSFRFLTADDKEFDSEIIKPVDENLKTNLIKLTVNTGGQKDVHTYISCSNCTSKLNVQDSITLRRVLELPSNNLNITDWFCHRHDDEKLFPENNNDTNQIFHEQSQTFQPKINDLFYAPFSFLLNSQNFDETKLRRKNQYVYCKRCLQLLGESNTKNTTKFWWESVKFQDKFIYDVSPIELVKNVISNHLACDVYIAPIVKIIFETRNPTDDKKQHILIQVMDKNLKLLHLNIESMKLVETKAIKVMFLKLTEGVPDDDQTLNYWQKDLNVTNFELSYKMFRLLIEYLESQSELIPGVYRNSNNGFQLTYIQLTQTN
jgi:hypothetical protein